MLGKSEGTGRGIGDHHKTTRNRPHGLWSRPCGERGGIQRTLRLGGLRGLEPHVRALASGYGSEGVRVFRQHYNTLRHSVQLTQPSNPHEQSAKAKATHKKAKQAEEQAG